MGLQGWEQCQTLSLHVYPPWLSARAVEMSLVINSTAPNHKINSSNFFPLCMTETMLSLGNPYQMCVFICSRLGSGLSGG